MPLIRETSASLKSEAAQPQPLSATFIGDMQCLAEERGPERNEISSVPRSRGTHWE